MSERAVVMGQGYVGLPVAIRAVEAGYDVVGFELDETKVAALNAGSSHVEDITDERLAAALASGRYRASSDTADLADFDIAVISVPTPMREGAPDLSYIERASETLAPFVREGSTVILESTTYPGTTDTDLREVLEAGSKLKAGADFHLAFSPEREDPGNETYGTAAIPKVVGGDGPAALELAIKLYDAAVVKTVPASSPATAEAVKLTENIFRSVNIALVNELKVIFDAMGIDVWEVIDAAKTKPFGFMPFYPGPGLGGHCIPIDPFYLTWKAR